MANDVTVESVELGKFLINMANINKIALNILDDLSEKALSEIQKNYTNSEYEPGEIMDFTKVGTETDKTVSMSGPQAIYSEFGTGTRGGLHPHPMKNNFKLNPYNSGRTIRAATSKVTEKSGIPAGTLYWTYKDPTGEIQYTQGIPAQMQVYKAGKTVINEMPAIVTKNLREVF